MSPQDYTQIRNAVALLAGACDFAHDRDGQGFAKSDTYLGHDLATTPIERWTDEIAALARNLVVPKYSRQLRDAGIDPESLPEPEVEDEKRLLRLRRAFTRLRRQRREAQWLERAEERRQRRAAEEAERGFVVTVDGDLVALVSKRYPGPEAVAAVRRMGARWDGGAKVWTVPLSRAAAVLEVIQAEHARADEEVLETLRRAAAASDWKPGFRVAFAEGDVLELRSSGFPGQEAIAQVKAIGARFDKESKIWTVAVQEAPAVLRMFESATAHPADEGVRRKLTDAARERREMSELSRQADAELEVPGLGGTLRPLQRAGVQLIDEKRLIVDPATDGGEAVRRSMTQELVRLIRAAGGGR